MEQGADNSNKYQFPSLCQSFEWKNVWAGCGRKREDKKSLKKMGEEYKMLLSLLNFVGRKKHDKHPIRGKQGMRNEQTLLHIYLHFHLSHSPQTKNDQESMASHFFYLSNFFSKQTTKLKARCQFVFLKRNKSIKILK